MRTVHDADNRVVEENKELANRGIARAELAIILFFSAKSGIDSVLCYMLCDFRGVLKLGRYTALGARRRGEGVNIIR